MGESVRQYCVELTVSKLGAIARVLQLSAVQYDFGCYRYLIKRLGDGSGLRVLW